jgi:hypothetical protein
MVYSLGTSTARGLLRGEMRAAGQLARARVFRCIEEEENYAAP